MDAAVSQYVERVLSLVDTDPIAIQQSTPELLEQLMRDFSERQWLTKPAPDKWSAAEILAHLSDSEIVAAFRVRKTISEPGCNIAAYAQDAWSAALSYDKRAPAESLHLFTALRQANLRLYRTLTPDQWNAFGLHSERGRETVQQLVRLLAGHDRNHLAQIEQALRTRRG